MVLSHLDKQNRNKINLDPHMHSKFSLRSFIDQNVNVITINLLEKERETIFMVLE